MGKWKSDICLTLPSMQLGWNSNPTNSGMLIITGIYDRLIKTPNHQYIKNWQKFKEHLENNAPADVLSTEEYMKTMHELDIVAPGLTSEALNSSNAEDDSTVRKNAVMIQKKVIAKREQVFL